MSAHTPGPWAKVEGIEGGAFTVYLPGDGMVICSRNPYEAKADEFASNACLIAAAPELLAACQKFMYSVPHTEIRGEPGSLLEVVRNAIFKATGEQA